MIQFDEHIFQMGGEKPPTRYVRSVGSINFHDISRQFQTTFPAGWEFPQMVV